MAANGMWLVNDRTKDRILLARYYPGSGWVPHIDFEAHLVEAFQADHGHRLFRPAPEGSTDWRIEYDSASLPVQEPQPLLKRRAL
ncbi:hypothetical protein [Microvirga pudoricolor]|uniref:hypothetical protein n=1 Tax=Microvirga pudoricolor TaxID=2778729 RepID=UPI00195007ED|nr:hypothetical protein [Microvirga pudoricolor]MBM6594519.1 hypothetical protein [Microvirga pudoricolor]